MTDTPLLGHSAGSVCGTDPGGRGLCVPWASADSLPDPQHGLPAEAACGRGSLRSGPRPYRRQLCWPGSCWPALYSLYRPVWWEDSGTCTAAVSPAAGTRGTATTIRTAAWCTWIWLSWRWRSTRSSGAAAQVHGAVPPDVRRPPVCGVVRRGAGFSPDAYYRMLTDGLARTLTAELTENRAGFLDSRPELPLEPIEAPGLDGFSGGRRRPMEQAHPNSLPCFGRKPGPVHLVHRIRRPADADRLFRRSPLRLNEQNTRRTAVRRGVSAVCLFQRIRQVQGDGAVLQTKAGMPMPPFFFTAS